MAKRSFTEGNWRKDPWFKELCKALSACENEEQVAAFLRDVGTLTELQAWSERFEVARLIAQGRTYREITEITGASTTTVTRVARFLQGGEGGYQRVLKMLRPRSLPAKAASHHHGTHTREETLASMS